MTFGCRGAAEWREAATPGAPSPSTRTPATAARPFPRARLSLLPFLFLLGLLVGCRGDGRGDPVPGSVEVALTPTPPVVGPTLLVVRIRDDEGGPVGGASVDVEGTMDHAGMVPVRATAKDQGDGSYRIERFRFTMGGDWVLRVQVGLPDGRSGTHETRVRVVSGGPPGERSDP